MDPHKYVLVFVTMKGGEDLVNKLMSKVEKGGDACTGIKEHTIVVSLVFASQDESVQGNGLFHQANGAMEAGVRGYDPRDDAD